MTGTEAPELGGWQDEPRLGRAAFLKASAVTVVAVAFGRLPSRAAAATGGKVRRFVRLSTIASGVDDLPTKHAAAYFHELEADGLLKMKPSRFAELAGITETGGPTTIPELEQTAAYRAPGGPECLRAVAAAW
ncbi:MAG: sugar dehydrogenase complex small subunit [Gaiellaceae bacterium]